MGSLYLFEEYAEAFVLGRMANEILSNDEIVESMDENLITRCFLSNSFNLSNILFRLLHCESDAVFDIEFDVIEDIEIAKYSLQDVVETSEFENVEIKKFSRLGKIISIPSRNEMTILPLDLPMCSIKTENVKIYLQYAGTGRTARIKSLQGLLLCNKMIRITFSRIVIRGELLSENIENILILENDEIVDCGETAPESSNVILMNDDESLHASVNEEVFLTKSLTGIAQDVEDSSGEEECLNREVSSICVRRGKAACVIVDVEDDDDDDNNNAHATDDWKFWPCFLSFYKKKNTWNG